MSKPFLMPPSSGRREYGADDFSYNPRPVNADADLHVRFLIAHRHGLSQGQRTTSFYAKRHLLKGGDARIGGDRDREWIIEDAAMTPIEHWRVEVGRADIEEERG